EIWKDDGLGLVVDGVPESVVTVGGDGTAVAGVDGLEIPHPFQLGDPAATKTQGRNLTVEAGIGKTLTLSGTIRGMGDLIKTGGGTVTLSAEENPFKGKLVLKEGRLSVDALAQLGHRTRDGLFFRGGLLRITGTAVTSLDAKYVGNWDDFDGGIDVADALNAVTVSSPVSVAEGGMFCKGGAGALYLDGGLSLNGGTFAADGCPDFCPVTVAGTLDLTGCSVVLTGTPDAVVTMARADAIVGAPTQAGRYRLFVKNNALIASKDVGTLMIVR
ncbi:MAG: hypothetical protein FWF84_05645, partial [Kiritimatiellaeota bacterium]|nr:hypothetical protein [Kiritimatiellota bacterium]